MPRKIVPKKFRYTTRKNGVLFVRYPVPKLKNPVWRKCEIETQEEVSRVIAEIKQEYLDGLQSAGIPTRCDNFFGYYLKLVKNNISESTLANRETMIRMYLKPPLGYFELREVQPVQFTMIYNKMIEDGKSSATVRKAHRIASAIFKEAVNLDLLKSNPVSKVRPPKLRAGSEKVKTMTLEETHRFLAESAKSDYGIIFEFALETGMRPQEYLALRWSDINLKKRTVEVTRALVHSATGGGYYFKETKTRKSRRTIPISQKLTDKLIEHQKKQKSYIQTLHERIRHKAKPSREYRKEKNKRALENYQELNLVFSSKDFTPIRDVNLSARYFKKIAADAGLDESLSLYALRHTMATMLLKAKVNPKIVSERLGHSSIVQTLDTYSHVLPDMQDEAMDALTEILYYPKPIG